MKIRPERRAVRSDLQSEIDHAPLTLVASTLPRQVYFRFSRLNVQTDNKPSRTSLPCPQNMKTSWPISQLWLTTSVPLDFRSYIAFIMFLRRVLELSKQDSQDKITLNVSSLPCAYDHRLQGSSLNESLCKTALAVQNIYASWQAHWRETSS